MNRQEEPDSDNHSTYKDGQIQSAIKDGTIICHPVGPESIVGNGIDVTLGEWYYRTEKDSQNTVYNPFDPDHVDQYFQGPFRAASHHEWASKGKQGSLKGISGNHPIIVLKPGERILAHTHEFIGIRAPGLSVMHPSMAWVSNGVLIGAGTNLNNPNKTRRWTLQIHNQNRHVSIVLPVGERIARITFHDSKIPLDAKLSANQDYPDIHRITRSWKPQHMLPTAYKESRQLPTPLSKGLKEPTSVKELMQPLKNEPTKISPLSAESTPSLSPVESAKTDNTSVRVSQLMAEKLLRIDKSLFVERHFDNEPTYTTPDSLDHATSRSYRSAIKSILGARREMLEKLESYLQSSGTDKLDARHEALNLLVPVLPVATETWIEFPKQASAIRRATKMLIHDEHEEAHDIGMSLKKLSGDSTNLQINALVKPSTESIEKRLAANLSPPPETANLIEYWPRNELELVPYLVYQFASLPLDQIVEEVNGWPYEDKHKIVADYFRTSSSFESAPQRVQYSWDLVCSFAELRQYQRQGLISGYAIQSLSPRFGYAVSRVIEESGASDLYEKCFDLSYGLYSKLQQANFQKEAQYAVLMGHKVRWSITLNIEQTVSLLYTHQNTSHLQQSSELLSAMRKTLEEAQPILSSSLISQNILP